MKKRILSLLLVMALALPMLCIIPAGAANAVVAKPTNATVLVNGTQRAFHAYNINGNNYFKLRDLAYVLSGTTKQFDVTFDAQNNAIQLLSNRAYTPVGGELSPGTDFSDKTALPTASKIILNGVNVNFSAYLINDNNYFKLRDVMRTFDVGVTWNSQANTIGIDTSISYTPEQTQPPTTPPESNSTQLTVEEVSKKSAQVVTLHTYDSTGQGIALGSGFFISADGKIATNYHVIEGASYVKVYTEAGNAFDITSVWDYSVEQDIAVLQSTVVSTPYLTLGDSDQVSLGQSVIAMGSPEGLTNTVSTGVISSIRSSPRKEGLTDMQISAPISHGSSGGPVFDMNGNVIALAYSGYKEGQNLNFAIPVNELKSFMSYTKPMSFQEVLKAENFNPNIPPSDIMNLDDLSAYFSKAYQTVALTSQLSIKIDDIDLLWSDDYTGIYIYVDITDYDSISNLIEYMQASSQSTDTLGAMCHDIVKTVADYYPTYEQFGGIDLFFSVSKNPGDGFDSAVYNKSTGLWDIIETILFFSYDSSGYNYYLD